MHQRTFPILIVRGILAVTILLGVASQIQSAKAEEWTKSYTVSGRAQVKVSTNDGSVKIITSDTKQVEFHVDYSGFELNKNLHIDSRQDGDHIELEARLMNHISILWFGHNSKYLHIEVHMPRDADLQATAGDGPIEASSLNGNISIYTGDGSVKANSLSGTISLHTSDGSITVDNLKGDMRLHSGDGSIEAHDLDGKVDADSGDGHIRLAGRFDALNIKTGDGSVDARANSGSKMSANWTIHTGDGSVDLVLPSDFQANIDASTGDGHISLGIPVTVEGNFSNSRIHGKMNGGGQSLTIHTGDGSIRLSKS